MRNLLSFFILLLTCTLLVQASTNTNDKTRLKPKPGNVVIAFRGDDNSSSGGENTYNSEQSNGENGSGDAPPDVPPKPSRGRGNGNDPTHSGDPKNSIIAYSNGVVSPAISISVYPNPASDFLLLELPNSYSETPTMFSIYTMNGQIALSASSNDWRNELDVRQLVSGIYLLVVQNGDNIWSQQVSITH
jgi:hypothetical protein